MKYTKQLSAVWIVLKQTVAVLIVAVFFASLSFYLGIDMFASKKFTLASAAPLALSLVITLTCVYAFFSLITRIHKIRRSWCFELDEEWCRLLAPFDNSKEAFEIAYKDILKLSLEAYIGGEGDTQYQWYLYTREAGCEVKNTFNLGPFAIEPMVNKLQSLCAIEVVTIDLKGQQAAWIYRSTFQKLATGLFWGLISVLCIYTAGQGLIFLFNNLE
jgi:hypothetical protein